MTRATTIAALYALFALLATSINLCCQWIVLQILAVLQLSAWVELGVALVVGTGAGLVAKYVLDKHYIFRDASRGAAHHARRFSLYTATGGVTTVIFWSAEIVGSMVDPGGAGMYVGGGLGLAVGYLLKYQLDKSFVFGVKAEARARATTENAI
ncbi:GtrA family protein [Ancylobacter sp. Lp-2]|uniref:GtrA family protein n=1 Tax=Ancylobacter sp. Lp-2 TaxID=2881339 RepID=UPI001E45D52C|nr:GtrA family protein [Ancylobacter sp. Lp-2]MCB4767112.1 GtrA family protein [Ancylobacter sp. Lp-2]